jgi:metallo-beta-lactamase family protein
MDHCGNLPALVRQGFTGPIYCTGATRDLIALMLADAARFQEEDAYVLTVIGRPNEPAADPPFTRSDVDQTIRQCVPLGYGQTHVFTPDLDVSLVSAGHILGSAMVALTINHRGQQHRLTFTGDLGRAFPPLLHPAAAVPPADLLISESTYGGRQIEPLADAAAKLEAVVRKTVERGGKVLIPAFSLGRTQVVAYLLHLALLSGRIPAVPIYVDSPLAADIADVYCRHPDSLNAEYAAYCKGDCSLPHSTPEQAIRHIRWADESKELTTRREPCVIISPGGMCEGGRIVRHLKHHIDDPRCTVVMISYQAPHSLGRRLLQPGPRVRIHGQVYNRWSDFVELPGFSAHADQRELLAMLGPLANHTTRVCLVHGEPEQAEALGGRLREKGFGDVAIPIRGETIRIA